MRLRKLDFRSLLKLFFLGEELLKCFEIPVLKFHTNSSRVVIELKDGVIFLKNH